MYKSYKIEKIAYNTSLYIDLKIFTGLNTKKIAGRGSLSNSTISGRIEEIAKDVENTLLYHLRIGSSL